ncbi:hypothetical protein [Parasitella parasitica]|uniref:Reverse transcriptase domain-containing protein n=1 Tax=Parasitella parasitica TaxID=35722 RepID=A0A0B7N316_9FUNG|nr:hypothetical protein [Parasitella parasitica]
MEQHNFIEEPYKINTIVVDLQGTEWMQSIFNHYGDNVDDAFSIISLLAGHFEGLIDLENPRNLFELDNDDDIIADDDSIDIDVGFDHFIPNNNNNNTRFANYSPRLHICSLISNDYFDLFRTNSGSLINNFYPHVGVTLNKSNNINDDSSKHLENINTFSTDVSTKNLENENASDKVRTNNLPISNSSPYQLCYGHSSKTAGINCKDNILLLKTAPKSPTVVTHNCKRIIFSSTTTQPGTTLNSSCPTLPLNAMLTEFHEFIPGDNGYKHRRNVISNISCSTPNRQLPKEKTHNSSYITEEQLVEDKEILTKLPAKYHDFKDVFSKIEADKLPPHRPYNYTIPLKPNTEVPFGPLYNLSKIELQTLYDYIQENLKKGFIVRSDSPAGAPVLFVKKKDGTLRMCVDYRGLNKITIPNRCPLPLISETLDRLHNAGIFTKLDMRGAYNLVRMSESDAWKTVFHTRYGHFHHRVMSFGLNSATGTFQAFVNDVMRDFLDTFLVVYLDDYLMYSRNQDEHTKHVRMVLQRLRESKLSQIRKMQIRRDQSPIPWFCHYP